MLVYLRDGSAQTVVSAAALWWKLQIQLSISPSHNILTPGQPVPALTLQRQMPGRVATGVPIFKSWYDPTWKNPGIEPRVCRSRGGRLDHQANEAIHTYGDNSTKGTETDDKQAWRVCLLVGCLTSQQQASVSQGRICSDNFTCCHTEIEVADPTFYLTQSLYTDTGPTSPSADPITPGAWQGSHWSANV